MNPLREQILQKYPHFIAPHYEKLLNAETPQKQVEAALHVFEVGMRALALFLISQYLIHDKDKIQHKPFSELLADSLLYATFGTWPRVFFAAMEAYRDRPDLLFMSELHDLYWKREQDEFVSRSEIRKPFEKMTQVWADQRPRSPAYPQSETEWEELAREAVEAVEQFLGYFAFIENYKVICIKARDEEGYWYEDRTGLMVMLASEKISTSQYLEPDRYYLYKLKTNEFFHLHPLLVLLSNLPPSLERHSDGVGFFDHLEKEASYYWEPNLGQLLPQPDLMSSVLDWVYFAIERYKAYQREISQLDWEILREVCQAISEDTMGNSHAKYQRKLYLQRDEVVEAFENFLSSEKTCFVLTGKSGVGKTNFVLSLLDDYQGQIGDLCFLVYNGAFLSLDREIKDEISHQFNQRLRFRGREEQAQIGDFLWEIDRIPGIKERKFVLIIDAINENGQPALLLKSIDQMIQSVGKEQHWLKIVITSRPEAWRRMYRQAKPLTENRYYRMGGQQELGIEMQQFQMVGAVDQASGLTYTMPRFGKDEVKVAFEKYQQVFRLTSHYDELRPVVRKELCDPLIMRLVAEMYAERAIPTTIRINDIYRNYVRALIQSERLQPEDEEFLLEEIVPLMGEDGYSNEVTSEQINRHRLRPQILGKEVDSSGRAVNQSFQNLSDADILTRYLGELDYMIRFTFERFYDYYFGQYLYKQIKSEPSLEPRYLEWVENIPQSPYLWGAIKQTLLAHLEDLSKDNIEVAQHLISSMAQTATAPVRELLVRTLADYHRDEAAVVSKWATHLFGVDPLDKDEISVSQRVAIEVAAQTENIALLEQAAKVKSEPIRAVTVQHIYYLWQRNPEIGFCVLDNLSRAVKGRWLLPRNEVLQSCLALSLTILFNHYSDPSVRRNLQRIWRRILDDIFFINADKFDTWQENLKVKIRELLLKGVVQFTLRNVAQLPKEGTMGAADLYHFWAGPGRDERFTLFDKMVKVLDLEAYDVQEMRNALMPAVENRDMLCTYVTLIAMTTSLLERPKETLPIVREFFEAGQKVEPSPPSFGYTPWVVAVNMARQEKIDPYFWQTFLEMVQTIKDTSEGMWYSAKNSFRFMYLHSHDNLYERQFGGELPSPLAREFLDKKIKAQDYDLLKDYIDRELTYSGNVRLIVAGLKFILNYNIEDERITRSIATLLRRGRNHYPEEVENFLLETNVLPEIKSQVQTQGTTERLHDLWTYQALTFFEDSVLFSRNSSIAQVSYWLLHQATHCKDLAEWVTLLFKGSANLLHGGPVFPDVPSDWSH